MILSYPDPSIEFEEIILRKMKIGLQEQISRHLDLQVNWNDIANTWIARLESYVWSRDVGTYELSVPSNWWEHFKERWFPNWMLMRFPIKYTVHVFDVKSTYPNFNYEIPDESFVLKVFQHKYERLEKIK